MKKYFILFFITISFVVVQSAFSAENSGVDIDWLQLCMGLFGGLAIFLTGLEQLADGLKKAAGETLRVMLAKLTTNRIMGAITGAVVTGILNSSSITTVLVVGFVTAGMMTLTQSVGVIMGANIGSTVTAQILAFNVSYYSLMPVALGFFMLFMAKNEKIRHYGMMIMGLGLVFYGMSVMSDGMRPLRDYPPFLEMLQKMENPFFGILAGAVFTGLVQSSAATVGIAITMASQGFLGLQAGIALALGANIGTCVTALMAAIGKPTEAVRAAVVHIGFNILGVMLWFFFIDDLAALFESGQVVEYVGNSVPRQIANANTLFNIVNTVVFLPFAPLFAYVVTKLVPDKRVEEVTITPIFLDDSALDVPSIALDNTRKELGRICEIIVDMFENMGRAVSTSNVANIQELRREDDKVDILEKEIVQYLGLIRQRTLSEAESDEHRVLMVSAINIETLADVIEKDLVRLAVSFYEDNYRSSHKTLKLIRELYYHVLYCVRQMTLVVREKNMDAASRLLNEQEKIYKLHDALILRKAERLGDETEGALKIARIEVSIADKLLRIFSLAKRVVHENGGTKDENNVIPMIEQDAENPSDE